MISDGSLTRGGAFGLGDINIKIGGSGLAEVREIGVGVIDCSSGDVMMGLCGDENTGGESFRREQSFDLGLIDILDRA